MCPESLIRLALSNVTRAALLSIQNMLFERAGTQVKKKKKKNVLPLKHKTEAKSQNAEHLFLIMYVYVLHLRRFRGCLKSCDEFVALQKSS